MEHISSHHKDPSGRLVLSIILNALITILEIVGGILSNSLALISDAVHNLSDTMALMLAWVAGKVGKKQPDTRKTFGYKRFEILSAFINASVLTAVSIYLIYESVLRFLNPEPVKTGLMLVVALAGLAANLLSVLFLHRDSRHSLNVRAAYLHLLGDTLSSVAVIAGAIVIGLTGLTFLDPLLTLVISVVIIRQAYGILHESTGILMQSTPRHLNLQQIKNSIETHHMIRNVHHVHCWQLQDNQVHFEAHLETVSDLKISDTGVILTEVESILREKFGISHTTFQIEYGNCADLELIRHGKE